MSRRYRFLTNPRFFSFFTEKRLNLVEFFLILITVTAGVHIMFFFYLDGKNERVREAILAERLAKAQSEVKHLKAAAAKRNGTPRSVPASIKVASETETQTPDAHAHDHIDGSKSDDTVEIVHTGPLKGLPLDLAKEIHKEYTAASLARAKRYHEWDLRRKDHKERDIALAKRELAHGDVLLANSKKLSEISLAVLALMSPEQLEAERKELLKTQPAEEVDRFFTKVKEFGTAKSPEEIKQTVQDFKKNREPLLIKRQELVAEREQIQREWEELQRTKPLPPNLGLDEFYTEWKKRNSTKPTPP